MVKRSLSLEAHFRRKYHLCPTDPRYLAATETEIIEDYLEDEALNDAMKSEDEKNYERWVDEVKDEEKFRTWQQEMGRAICGAINRPEPSEIDTAKPVARRRFKAIRLKMGS
jgi:hypothetical protein